MHSANKATDSIRVADRHRENQRVVCQFLRDHKFKPDVSMKELAAPSKALAVEIFRYLAKEIGPPLEVHAATFEDDVIAMVKAFGIQPPPKSILRSVGSLSTPSTSILLLLRKLCDMLTYEEDVMGDIRGDDRCPDPAFEPVAAAKFELDILSAISRRYGRFLENNCTDEPTEEDIEAIMTFSREKRAESAAALAEQEARTASVEQEVERLQKRKAAVASLKEANDASERQNDDVRTELSELRAKLVDLQNERALVEKKRAKVRAENVRLQRERDEAQRVLESQEACKPEREELMRRIARAKSQLEERKLEIASLREANEAQEQANAAALEAYRTAAKRANHAISRLPGLRPELSRLSGSVPRFADVTMSDVEKAASECTDGNKQKLAELVKRLSYEGSTDATVFLARVRQTLDVLAKQKMEQKEAAATALQESIAIRDEKRAALAKVNAQCDSLRDAIAKQTSARDTAAGQLTAMRQEVLDSIQQKEASFADELSQWNARVAAADEALADSRARQQKILSEVENSVKCEKANAQEFLRTHTTLVADAAGELDALLSKAAAEVGNDCE